MVWIFSFIHRHGIRDLATLEGNFCLDFQAFNRVNLSDGEFARLRDGIVTGNGYSKTLLCFLQLFVVHNRNDTWCFPNNKHARQLTDIAQRHHLPVAALQTLVETTLCRRVFDGEHLSDCAVQVCANTLISALKQMGFVWK
jgi:hypothetical protein